MSKGLVERDKRSKAELLELQRQTTVETFPREGGDETKLVKLMSIIGEVIKESRYNCGAESLSGLLLNPHCA